ncbi:MAG TPA: hypothetical protein VFA63_05335 [Pseudonocardiaceae bacterium]|nr:hypothetical protein [Pseudonocardiaceae bacterium]
MLLVTQVATLHAVTGTAAVEATLPVAFQMTPRVRTDLMLRGAQVADLIGMANVAVVLGRVPIRVLHVAVALPMIPAVAVLVAHSTVIPVIPIPIAHSPVIPIPVTPPTVIPVIPIPVIPPVVVPAVPLVVLTPVVPVLPTAPVVITAVVVIAPLAVIVVGPARGVRPARRWGPAVRRFPTLRNHPADPTHPDRTEVVGSGHPQMRIVQETTEIVPDIIEHLGSQPVLAKRTLRHCMLLRTR